MKKFVKDGVAVELSISPLQQPTTDRKAGSDFEIQFHIRNADTAAAITGLNPIAWLDRATAEAGEESSCQAKIRSFLSASLRARPEVDLNTYYLAVLNREGTVSVIDPLLDFGGMKLLALVFLGGEGADWAVSPDQQTLLVSIPSLNEVVAVDTSRWKVTSRIAVGEQPRRVALQPDGAYLWVGYSGAGGESSGGVSVVDVAERREIARIPTTGGDHEFAFTGDSRYAFVTNRIDGSLSVIDVRAPREIRRIATGSSPAALAYSALSNAVYVGHEDGVVVVVDAARHEIRSRIETAAGLRAMGFSPDGRWGFVLNASRDLVSVVDSSTDEIAQQIPVGRQPDQVAFTELFAYIRSAGSDEVTMIRLSTVAPGQQPDLTRFSGGQVAPEYGSGPSLPAAIVPALESNAVLVSNPADRIIYYYMEGMAAPMGSFQNYRREPMGVLTVRRNLRETQPGVYSTTFQLERGGQFDVPFLVDSPRLTTCFDYSIDVPEAEPQNKKLAVRIERMFDPITPAGAPFRVRVRVSDATGRPLNDVKDLRVLTFTPAAFQKRDWARLVGDGIYEATVIPPHSGVYYIFFESRSLGKSYRDFPHWIVQATGEADAGTGGRGDGGNSTLEEGGHQ